MHDYSIHHLRVLDDPNGGIDYVGFVQAESLEEAYFKSQNWDEKGWNKRGETRSTSVGDIIQSNYGFYKVEGRGFKRIDN